MKINKSSCINRIKIVSILLIIFTFSIVIRLHLINRPLGNHHEWCTAHYLITLNIWYENDPTLQYFTPIMHSGKLIEQNNNWISSGVQDNDYNYYYISYPPFSFIAPYIILKLLNQYPSVLNLQIFNIVTQYICAMLIYILIRRNFNTTKLLREKYPAILGAVIYMFLPITLWFHSNVYTPDTFVQLFFISSAILFLELLNENQLREEILFSVLFFISTFFMAYTEWISVLFALSILGYILINRNNLKYVKPMKLFLLAAIPIIANILAVIITVLQYSKVLGFIKVIDFMWGKYFYRSGLSENMFINPYSYINIIKHYLISFFPAVILIIILIYAIYIITTIANNAKAKPKLTRKEIPAFYIMSVPVILHHVIFFHFTVIHDFSVLKSATLFILIIICLYVFLNQIFKHLIRSNLKSIKIEKSIMYALLIFIILSSSAMFCYINRNNTDHYKKIGKILRSQADYCEYLFVEGVNYIEPQLIYYAGNSVYVWSDHERTQNLLADNNINCVILLRKDSKGEWNISSLEKIALYD